MSSNATNMPESTTDGKAATEDASAQSTNATPYTLTANDAEGLLFAKAQFSVAKISLDEAFLRLKEIDGRALRSKAMKKDTRKIRQLARDIIALAGDGGPQRRPGATNAAGQSGGDGGEGGGGPSGARGPDEAGATDGSSDRDGVDGPDKETGRPESDGPHGSIASTIVDGMEPPTTAGVEGIVEEQSKGLATLPSHPPPPPAANATDAGNAVNTSTADSTSAPPPPPSSSTNQFKGPERHAFHDAATSKLSPAEKPKFKDFNELLKSWLPEARHLTWQAVQQPNTIVPLAWQKEIAHVTTMIAAAKGSPPAVARQLIRQLLQPGINDPVGYGDSVRDPVRRTRLAACLALYVTGAFREFRRGMGLEGPVEGSTEEDEESHQAIAEALSRLSFSQHPFEKESLWRGWEPFEGWRDRLAAAAPPPADLQLTNQERRTFYEALTSSLAPDEERPTFKAFSRFLNAWDPASRRADFEAWRASNFHPCARSRMDLLYTLRAVLCVLDGRGNAEETLLSIHEGRGRDVLGFGDCLPNARSRRYWHTNLMLHLVDSFACFGDAVGLAG